MEDNLARNQRMRSFLTVMVSVTMVWLIWVMGQRTSAYQVANEDIIFTPGKSILAYYLFIFLLSLLPIFRILSLMVLPTTKDKKLESTTLPKGKQRSAQTIALMVFLSFAAGVAGYGYEAMQARLTITASSVVVHEGAGNRTISWDDIAKTRASNWFDAANQLE